MSNVYLAIIYYTAFFLVSAVGVAFCFIGNKDLSSADSHVIARGCDIIAKGSLIIAVNNTIYFVFQMLVILTRQDY